MATGCNCGRLLCFCSVVLFLLLADVAVAYDHERERETGLVGSTRELYLRGDTVTIPKSVSTELGESRFESFEEFERRELLDGYPSDPADPNCDNDPTLCAP